ncbi:hypothetical protein O6H91_04G102600 [Diphasiastrum complanatum]|uniref:Uncharacterized protein n=1 Tax=Diphasiastrum complanatum TaxID=34168 RepID=A0ACC2E043_DIPCM|nr:hypothetical protein O6H91_04G102600 [Diphasiastrum complanatum]
MNRDQIVDLNTLLMFRSKSFNQRKTLTKLKSFTEIARLSSARTIRKLKSFGGFEGLKQVSLIKSIKSLFQDKLVKIINTTNHEIVLKECEHRVWGADIMVVSAKEARYLALKHLGPCTRIGAMEVGQDGKRIPTSIYLHKDQLKDCFRIFFKYSEENDMFYLQTD